MFSIPHRGQLRKTSTGLPLNLEVDGDGADVSSPAIVLNATGIYQKSGYTGAVEDAGSANPDNIRYDATLGPSGGYIFNLKTTGLPSGSFNLTYTAGGASSASYAVGFGVK